MNHKNTFTPALRKLIQQPFYRLFAAFVLVMMGLSSVASPGKGELPPYTFTVTVTQDNQIADGLHDDLVKVVVTDNATGLPAVISVNFKLQGATASNSAMTDATGTVTYPVNNTVVGPTTLSVTVNGVTQIITVNFIAGPASPNPPGNPAGGTNFFITQDNQIVGGPPDKVKAHITDAFGNSVGAGTQVTITITGVGTAASTAELPGNVTTIIVTTDANGDVEVPITNTKAGTVEMSASIIDPATGLPAFINGSTQTVTFIVGQPSPTAPNAPPGSGTNFFITLNNQTAGVGADKVKAYITDAYGNPIGAGVSVTITITGNGTAAGNAQLPGNVKTIIVTTDGTSSVEVPITDITAGTVELSATIIDPATGNPASINGSTQTVTFVAGQPSPTAPNAPAGTGTNFFITQDNQVVGAAPDKVKAYITDAYGNSVGAGVAVTITITGVGTAAGPAGLPGNVKTITVMTNAAGEVEVPITDTKAGTVELSATIIDPATGNPAAINGSTQTVTFVTSSPSPTAPGAPGGSGTNFFITLDNQTAGSGADKVKAYITDNYGNPVGAGTQVTITITGVGTAAGNAQLPGNVKTIIVTTDGSSSVEIPITDIQAGTVELSASIIDPATGNPAFITGSTQTVTFVVGPPSPTAPNAPVGAGTNFFITQDKQPVDGAPDKVKAHITDAYGNPIGAGVAVTITITGNGTAAGPAELPGNVKTITVTTDANGEVEVPITDTKAGTVELSATIIDPVTGNPIAALKGSTQTVTFVAGTPVPVAPLAPGGTGSQLTVTQDNRVADGKQVDSVKAHITDKYGNPVAGVPVTFTITPGGTATSGAQLVAVGGTTTLVTDANGDIEIAITSTVPGTVNINGAINTTDLVNGSAQTVTFANAPDVHNPLTALIVVVYEALADGQGQTIVKAHVVDLAGLPISGQDVTFAIDSGDAKMATPATATTDANGDAFITLTSTKPGFVLITATVDGQAIIYGSPARVKFATINIYVPKVFTPNNDGTNDVLKPILVGIKEFHYMSVYNRWGNLIFTTQDPNRGWDGTFKGVAQPVESYLWIAEGVDINGNKIVQKGITSLVR